MARFLVAAYWQRSSLLKTFENLHRTLRETGSFPWANLDPEQRLGDGILVAVQRSASTSVLKISSTTCQFLEKLQAVNAVKPGQAYSLGPAWGFE
jgi:hypothetical protein